MTQNQRFLFRSTEYDMLKASLYEDSELSHENGNENLKKLYSLKNIKIARKIIR
jgi:hypothetical protein